MHALIIIPAAAKEQCEVYAAQLAPPDNAGENFTVKLYAKDSEVDDTITHYACAPEFQSEETLNQASQIAAGVPGAIFIQYDLRDGINLSETLDNNNLRLAKQVPL